MALEAVTGPQWAAIGAVVGMALNRLFDGLIKYVKAKAEAKNSMSQADQERAAAEAGQEEKKEIRTSEEMWKLVQDLRTARAEDRVEYDRREAALAARVDTLSKSLDECHREHREAAVELGAVKARLEIQEKRTRPRRERGDDGGSGLHKPLGDDQ